MIDGVFPTVDHGLYLMNCSSLSGSSGITLRPLSAKESPELLGDLVDRSRRADWTVFCTQEASRGLATVVVAAFAGDRPVGAVMARAVNGELGQLMVPIYEAGYREAVVVPLLQSVFRHETIRSLRTVTCAVEVKDDHQVELQFAGMNLATEVQSMVQLVSSAKSSRAFSIRSMRIERTTEADGLISLIERTYQESLDCPSVKLFGGASSMIEIYSSIYDTAEAEWFIASVDHEPAGCVLLAFDERLGQSEIAYLGVVPNARRMGFGRQLLAFAEQWSFEKKGRSIIVDVDCENLPAVELYLSRGYVPFDFHRVYSISFARR